MSHWINYLHRPDFLWLPLPPHIRGFDTSIHSADRDGPGLYYKGKKLPLSGKWRAVVECPEFNYQGRIIPHGKLRQEDEDVQRAVLQDRRAENWTSLADLECAWSTNDSDVIEETSKSRIWQLLAEEPRVQSFGIVSAMTRDIDAISGSKAKRKVQERRHRSLRRKLMQLVDQSRGEDFPVGFFEVTGRWVNAIGRLERERALFTVNVPRSQLEDFSGAFDQCTFIYRGPDTQSETVLYTHPKGERRKPYSRERVLNLYKTGREAAPYGLKKYSKFKIPEIMEQIRNRPGLARLPVGVELSVFNDPMLHHSVIEHFRMTMWGMEPYIILPKHCNVVHYVGQNPSFGWKNFLEISDNEFEQPKDERKRSSDRFTRILEGRRGEFNEQFYWYDGQFFG